MSVSPDREKDASKFPRQRHDRDSLSSPLCDAVRPRYQGERFRAAVEQETMRGLDQQVSTSWRAGLGDSSLPLALSGAPLGRCQAE